MTESPQPALDAAPDAAADVVADRAKRPLNILVYGINFWPELTGVGKYSGEMCQWLADHGHLIEVVTAPPYYPAWRVSAGYQSHAYRVEKWATAGRVRITRCPLWVPRQVNTLRRLLHLTSFALSSLPALWAGLRRRPDILLVIAPTLLVAPAALAMARWWQIPAWLHMQDFEVDAMFGLGLGGSQNWLRQIALAIESRLLRSFDRASSITLHMVSRLVAKGVRPFRCVLFPNWVDLSAIFPMCGPNAFRAQLGVGDGDILVLYAGNMGEKQGLEILVDAARILQGQPGIRFVLAGDGAARQRLQRAAEGLDSVFWVSLQPIERLNELLNSADIHVLPQRADAADMVMPSKLIGMFASGRATVGTAARDTQLGQVLGAAGQRVEPGDAQALAAALLGLANNTEQRHALGQRGRAFAERHFAVDSIMADFESRLTELAN